jgi:hypothetical protein
MRPRWRKITVKNLEFRWKIGRSGFVVIQDKDGKRIFGDHASKLKNTSVSAFETANSHGAQFGAITPSNIERFINLTYGRN